MDAQARRHRYANDSDYADRERHRQRELKRVRRADPIYAEKTRQYQRDYYATHPAHAERCRQYQANLRRPFLEAKNRLGCVRCPTLGNTHRWNYSALEFHHLDPASKDFEINIAHYFTHKMNGLGVEAAKCILLCEGCHAEVHVLLREDADKYWQEVRHLEQQQRCQIDKEMAILIAKQ